MVLVVSFSKEIISGNTYFRNWLPDTDPHINLWVIMNNSPFNMKYDSYYQLFLHDIDRPCYIILLAFWSACPNQNHPPPPPVPRHGCSQSLIYVTLKKIYHWPFQRAKLRRKVQFYTNKFIKQRKKWYESTVT